MNIRSNYKGSSLQNSQGYRPIPAKGKEEKVFLDILKKKSEEKAEPINKSCILGRWTLVSTGKHSGKICSITYTEDSTNSDPIMMTVDGENRIHIKDIDPENATGLEMQMFCSYLDATGRGTGGTFGTYNDLRSAKSVAFLEAGGNLEDSVPTEEQLETMLYNWTEMTRKYVEAVKPNDPKQYRRLKILYDALLNKQTI